MFCFCQRGRQRPPACALPAVVDGYQARDPVPQLPSLAQERALCLSLLEVQETHQAAS